MERTYSFRVQGLRCASCVFVTEEALGAVPGTRQAKTFLSEERVEIIGDFGDASEEEVAQKLQEAVQSHGYTLIASSERPSVPWREFAYAVPFAAVFVGIFFLLQRLGIVDLLSVSEVTYGAAFTIGLVASVSTCMAVVGGLVLSLSATFAKSGERVRPQVSFHLARLAAFFVLGGSIGALGSFVQLGATSTMVLGIFVSVVLLVLGVNLLDVFPWMKSLEMRLPTKFAAHVHELKSMRHSIAPVLAGIATFFLPCGFTQSMQLYTLTTGSFWKGGLTMLAFALGTLPVLALLSFGSLGMRTKLQSGVFFKTAGMVVIVFALFTLMTTLAGAGVINPFFAF